MTVTSDMISRLRKMVNEPTSTNYSDDSLEEIIERNWCIDSNGEAPLVPDFSTVPPSMVDNENWIPTYDLNASAADVWDEKASALVEEFDFQADGGNYRRNQKYLSAVDMSARYRSRSMIKSIEVKKYPREYRDV